jgi:hypothetical protein
VLSALSSLDDLTRNFEPKDVGRAGRRRIGSALLQHVGPVHARSGDMDQYFAGTWPRNRSLDDLEAAAPVRDDGLHR